MAEVPSVAVQLVLPNEPCAVCTDQNYWQCAALGFCNLAATVAHLWQLPPKTKQVAYAGTTITCRPRVQPERSVRCSSSRVPYLCRTSLEYNSSSEHSKPKADRTGPCKQRKSVLRLPGVSQEAVRVELARLVPSSRTASQKQRSSPVFP